MLREGFMGSSEFLQKIFLHEHRDAKDFKGTVQPGYLAPGTPHELLVLLL